MTHQLTWQTTSGARGLVCSKFRALKAVPSGSEPSVKVTLDSREEFESLLAELEMHFAAQRFADEDAALKAITQYALERANRKR